MKKLKDIIECDYDLEINDIKTDSREIKEKDLFVAIKGFNIDHSLYIDDAIKNGAVAIITDKDYEASIPIIKVDNVGKTLTSICKKFYSIDPNIQLIGVTGTDGKTTTASIIKQLLQHRINTAYIGTNGIEYKEEKMKTENTTPMIEKLYQYLEQLSKKKVKNISMEISSEALLHHRIDGLTFKYIIYTNITEDHLNIHKTIEKYIQSKMELVNYLSPKGIIIYNGDDINLEELKKIDRKKYSYGKEKKNTFLIENIRYYPNKTTFSIKHNSNIYPIESPYLGEYNIYNLTAAFIVCFLEKIDPKTIITWIKELKPIDGRGEYLCFGQKYDIVLDYAHTLNAIKNIVRSVKNKYQRVIVLTGSAGGREKEKRRKIGDYLLNNVDLVIFTMDDPREEDVDDIIDEMIGDNQNQNYQRIVERKSAIEYALNQARENDIVLILGKGRDEYMAIQDKKICYSDYVEIKKILNSKK